MKAAAELVQDRRRDICPRVRRVLLSSDCKAAFYVSDRELNVTQSDVSGKPATHQQ